jgi:hypothetical protein
LWSSLPTNLPLVRALRSDPDEEDALRLAAAFVRGRYSTQ